MSSETLPAWFWVIYYLVLIGTMAMSVRAIFQGKIVALSVIGVVLIVLSQLLSINLIGRMEGTELDYVVSSLHGGALWAYALVAIYSYLVFWWILYVRAWRFV
ncbi:hypothetical protein [Alkalihalobacillus sp. R86527]|uniref:hypothetical protein n=1 Tax=Alkalihalobacillus sp. R86527 TaxID=3093863 RepID=UPI003671CB7D